MLTGYNPTTIGGYAAALGAAEMPQISPSDAAATQTAGILGAAIPPSDQSMLMNDPNFNHSLGLQGWMGALNYPGGPGGGGWANAQPPPAQGFDQFSNYGFGNFTPQSQQQALFYQQLAQWQQAQQAPQLQRTSIDWSGYGSGQGPTPPPPNMAGYPTPPGYPTPQSAVAQVNGMMAPPPAQGTPTAPGTAPTMAGAPRPQMALGPMPGAGAPAAMQFSPDAQAPGIASAAYRPPAGAMTAQGGPAASGGAPGAPLQAGSAAYADQLRQGGVTAGQPPSPGIGPPMGPGGIPAIGQYANPLFQQGQQSRAQQQAYMGEIARGISGQAPSLAQIQLKQGMDSNIAAQNALAASGGPSNAAFASRQAMQNAAASGQALAGQSAALRAQEYQQAMSQMGQATAQARAQDLAAAGMSYQNALAQAQMEQGMNSQQAQLQMQQGALNQQGALGYYGMAQGTQNQDLASRMHYMDLMGQKYGVDRGVALQQQQMQQQHSDNLLGGILGATGAVVGTIFGGPAGGVAGYGAGTAVGKGLGG
jgi:hypothetical protein